MSIEQVMDRWSNDEDFRSAFTADPKAAVKAAGLELTDEEWTTVEASNLTEQGEHALKERVSKTRIAGPRR